MSNANTDRAQRRQHQPVGAVTKGGGIVIADHDKQQWQGEVVVVQRALKTPFANGGIGLLALAKRIDQIAL